MAPRGGAPGWRRRREGRGAGRLQRDGRAAARCRLRDGRPAGRRRWHLVDPRGQHRGRRMRGVELDVAAQPLQVGQQIRGVLVAQVAVLLESLLDDLLEARRDRPVALEHRCRLANQDAGNHGTRRAAAERLDAGRHLVDHGAERKQVAPRVHLFAPGLLGRHVGHRAERRSRHRQLVVGRHRRRGVRRLDQLRQAEVEDLHAALVADEDVSRLDVAVDDPLGVRRVQSISQLDGEIEHVGHRDWRALDAVAQRLALERFHHDERRAVVVPDVEHRADAGVAERAGRAGFEAEALEGGFVAGRFGRQELEGDLAAETPVFGEVDHAHAAGAQGFQDPVV